MAATPLPHYGFRCFIPRTVTKPFADATVLGTGSRNSANDSCLHQILQTRGEPTIPFSPESSLLHVRCLDLLLLPANGPKASSPPLEVGALRRLSIGPFAGQHKQTTLIHCCGQLASWRLLPAPVEVELCTGAFQLSLEVPTTPEPFAECRECVVSLRSIPPSSLLGRVRPGYVWVRSKNHHFGGDSTCLDRVFCLWPWSSPLSSVGGPQLYVLRLDLSSWHAV